MAEPIVQSAAHLTAFLPWLRLKAPTTVSGFCFVPFRGDDGAVRANFTSVKKDLELIFSSYLDRAGKPIDSPVIVTSVDGDWHRSDDEFEKVAWAARILFLSCWASNQYYDRFVGHYIDSVPFRPIWQRFTGSSFIGLTAKRRDGHRQDGGYEHGEIKFNLPLQCLLDNAAVDEPFLEALNTGTASAASMTVDRLRTALAFVALANTDDELMDDAAETILMGSAFEQLFGIEGEGKARKLTTAFGDLFNGCGSVTVETAQANPAHSGIKVDTSKPEYEAAQKKWWVHKIWMRELYAVRSDYVHEGQAVGKGWSPFQHLVMAAFVFPLTVKKLLAAEGFYTLTEEDEVRCASIDKLLLSDSWRWHDDHGGWSAILNEERSRQGQARLAQKLSELFPQAPGE